MLDQSSAVYSIAAEWPKLRLVCMVTARLSGNLFAALS